MRKPLKRAALRAGQALGIQNRIAGSRWRGSRLAILCYHSVALDDEHRFNPRFSISPEKFECRLRLLRDGGFRVLPLGEAVGRLYQGSLPERSVCLTFDDGLYDFYVRAYPLLKKYGFPATVYQTTYYVTHPKPVFAMFCHYLLWRGRKSYRGGDLLGLGSHVDLSTEASRTAFGNRVLAMTIERGMRLAEKDALAERLARELNVDYQAVLATRILQLMTKDEIAELAPEIDFQLHTHRHRTPKNRELFVREIEDNRRCLSEMTGRDLKSLKHFCYPSGEYDLMFLPWLKDLGVASATTCENNLSTSGDEALLLPRIVDTENLDDSELESWLTGLSSIMRRLLA